VDPLSHRPFEAEAGIMVAIFSISQNIPEVIWEKTWGAMMVQAPIGIISWLHSAVASKYEASSKMMEMVDPYSNICPVATHSKAQIAINVFNLSIDLFLDLFVYLLKRPSCILIRLPKGNPQMRIFI
jgi:hypothetical protein